MGRIAPTLLALAVAAGLAACGGGHRTPALPGHVTTPLVRSGATTSTTPGPPTLQIDAIMPLTGPDASQGQALDDGMKLAFGELGPHIGGFDVDFVDSNDGSRTRGWSARALATFARAAATNSATIAYLGDLASGASQVTIPILGTAGIPQIITGSPDTALSSAPASPAGGARAALPSNYIRLAPSNAYQAAAILHALRKSERGFPACTKVAVAYGNDPDSVDLAAQIKLISGAFHPMVVLDPVEIDPGDLKTFGAFLNSVKAQGVTCAVLADTIAGGAVAVTDGLHEQLVGGGRIIGSSGVCTSAWTNPAQGGVPASLDPDLGCTAPGPGLGTVAGRQFVKDFKHAYRIDPPDPAAAYGYEAMSLTLRAIGMLGSSGDDRDDVLSELRSIVEPDSVIGGIDFVDSGTGIGDTYNTDYSLYSVLSGGTLSFSRQLPTTDSSASASAARAGDRLPSAPHVG